MWQSLARFVLQFKWILLFLLLAATAFMGYHASKVKLSYEFSKAIPTDNPKYVDYMSFRQKFGDDGNMLVVGITTKDMFTLRFYKAYSRMLDEIKKVGGVEDILSLPGAITLEQDPETEKLQAYRIFADTVLTQGDLDSSKQTFLNLPFYKNLLYNPAADAYLMGVHVNKDTLSSPARSKTIAGILAATSNFTEATHVQTHVSGLPLIRTLVADRVQKEMKLFLLCSLGLSVLILLLFFRSFTTTLISLLVVFTGVIWTVGLIELMGYQITLLTALIPSLVVVIGIPNCIYFINKYHTNLLLKQSRDEALVNMVSKMGVVTLFCNITAAIGFAVFSFTRSAILKEFGAVAGLSIMVIFVVSFILLPAILSMLPPPGKRELKYLQSKWIQSLITQIVQAVYHKPKLIWATTALVILFSIAGILRLRTEAHIVDDLPKTDIVYKDLKYFESNFKGVMPLEIMIDTRKPKGILQSSIDIRKIADFQDSVLAKLPGVGKPLSVVDGIKFSYQAISQGQGDSTYVLPAFGNPLQDLHKSLRVLQVKKQNNEMDAKDSAMMKLVGTFVDSTEQYLRLSMSMEDVGTTKLPAILKSIDSSVKQTFDSSYRVTLTGSTITFLEGSKFIINGLKESIGWAFLLIAVCMLYLFKSFKILVCSLIPNLVPLLVTAGIMGWAGVAIKPSTVLVFSVALGIAVDITIRFLVNYRQVLPAYDGDVPAAVKATIEQTGLSIIYTSLVLTAGFVIFCASSFGGTFALGWLTSVTLLVATATNLVLLPLLLITIMPKRKIP